MIFERLLDISALRAGIVLDDISLILEQPSPVALRGRTQNAEAATHSGHASAREPNMLNLGAHTARGQRRRESRMATLFIKVLREDIRGGGNTQSR